MTAGTLVCGGGFGCLDKDHSKAKRSALVDLDQIGTAAPTQ
jgi:hypothetical protein